MLSLVVALGRTAPHGKEDKSEERAGSASGSVVHDRGTNPRPRTLHPLDGFSDAVRITSVQRKTEGSAQKAKPKQRDFTVD